MVNHYFWIENACTTIWFAGRRERKEKNFGVSICAEWSFCCVALFNWIIAYQHFW
jgi:hypothetical protein